MMNNLMVKVHYGGL